MKRIGITGGIGSGKSTACRMFEALGVPVYYADDRAKWLMAHQPELKVALAETFGSQTFDKEGNLDRAYLASKVFNAPDELEKLNALVHPAVFEDGMEWEAEQERNGARYTLKEAALLFESGSYVTLDKVIVVSAPKEVRIERVMQRDGLSREEVLSRIARQWSQEDKEARADYLLNNDGNVLLLPQVIDLHQRLLDFALER